MHAEGHLAETIEQVGRLGVGDRLVVHHLARRRLAGRHYGNRLARVPVEDVLAVGGSQQVESDDAVRATGREPVGRIEPAAGEPQVGHHRSGLLTQPDLIQALDVVACAQRRGGEHLVHRDDAGAADAGQEDIVRGRDRLDVEIGQDRRLRGCPSALLLASVIGAPRVRGLHLDGDEGRAVAVEAAVVGVAGRLVDPRLTPEIGIDRLHRQAVGLDAAVAAAFTHRLVDQDARGAGGQRAAFALPSRIGCAVLVVDQHRHAGHVAQSLLSLVKAVAVPQNGALGECALVVPMGFVRADDDLFDTLGGQFVCQLRDGECTFGVLGAGHRHDLVVEELVRDVDARGDAGLHGELTGMEKRSVADVLEQMRDVGERRLTDPLATFATHLGEPGDGTVLPPRHRHHGVASDAATCQ
jgi:hypothetical protein